MQIKSVIDTDSTCVLGIAYMHAVWIVTQRNLIILAEYCQLPITIEPSEHLFIVYIFYGSKNHYYK